MRLRPPRTRRIKYECPPSRPEATEEEAKLGLIQLKAPMERVEGDRRDGPHKVPDMVGHSEISTGLGSRAGALLGL